jgi:peptidase E
MSDVRRQIIALGGGGFGSEPENAALDLYILEQARSSSPRILFIPTATGDSPYYVARFQQAFARYNCTRSVLPLFARTPELRSTVLEQDVIFVGGGNTKSMLAVWREWGLDDLLREAWESGIVLSGVSAGAICWFEQGLTDSWAASLEVLDCLGFLEGSCSPHYDGEADRRPSFHHFLVTGAIAPGIALDDGAAAHFVGRELVGVVASRPFAEGYHVSAGPDGVQERTLDVRRLEARTPGH